MHSGRRGVLAAVASSATRVCGQKQIGVANNDKKATSLWNHEVKDAIHAKKVACKVWLQTKADSSLHSRYLRWDRKFAALTVSKMQFWENFGRKNKLLGSQQIALASIWQTIRRVCGKNIILLDSSKTKWCPTQRWKGYPWQLENISKSFCDPVISTPLDSNSTRWSTCVFTSDGRRNRAINTRSSKANAVLREV